MDLSKVVKQENQQRKEEMQTHNLQQQIDELRRLVKEQSARHHWLEELYKQGELKQVQLQSLIEQHTQEQSVTEQSRRLDDQRLKQVVADLATRVDEPLRPIRELKAQVHELAEQLRADRERDRVDASQMEEAFKLIRDLQARFGLIDQEQSIVKRQAGELGTQIANLARDLNRAEESQRIEAQRLQRRAAEIQQMAADIRVEVQLQVPRITRLEELRKQIETRVEAYTPVIEELRGLLDQQAQSVQMVERQNTERYANLQERLEEIRPQLESSIFDLRQVEEQRQERLMQRLLRIEEHGHDLEARFPPIQRRLVELDEQSKATHLEEVMATEESVRRQIAFLEEEVARFLERRRPEPERGKEA